MTEFDPSPEQKAVIREKLFNAIDSQNAAVIGQTILEISGEFGVHTIRQVEEMLREAGSKIFFIAMPANFDPSQGKVRLPHSQEKEYPFFLRTSHSDKEAEEIKRQLGTDDIQNLKNLENTGLLSPVPGSRLSLSLNFRSN